MDIISKTLQPIVDSEWDEYKNIVDYWSNNNIHSIDIVSRLIENYVTDVLNEFTQDQPLTEKLLRIICDMCAKKVGESESKSNDWIKLMSDELFDRLYGVVNIKLL